MPDPGDLRARVDAAPPGERDRKTFRDRLRPYLLGAASLFDLSGALTYRAAREAVPPADDWRAVGDAFSEAGRALRDVMGNPVAGERED